MDPLDNPIWFALRTAHAALAQGDATIARYPADVAPFAAVAADGDRPSDLGLMDVLGAAAATVFVGALPTLPAHLRARRDSGVLQMICPGLADPLSAAIVEVRELGDRNLAAMQSLTARVYPWYFRARTPVMGRYLGVFDGDRLVAMGGERFRLEHARELSGICTDPDYVGRGYAGAIVRCLAESMLAANVMPFLHLSPQNTRARSLYRSLGFVARAELPMITVDGRA
jgi:ribosomal protein S18 acetylase RimI-like enzyme